MKWRLLLLSILAGLNLFSQELPINPQTGLVFIKDSIDIKGKTLQEVKDLMKNWGNTIKDVENLKRIFSLSNSRQTETIGLNFPLETVLTQDKGNNKFMTNGTMSYSKIKTNGLNAYSPTGTGGSIKFSFYYRVSSNKLIFEFTNLEGSSDGAHFGKYEDEKPPQDNGRGVGSLFFSKMSKKGWKELKYDYFAKIKILAKNLKDYATEFIQNKEKLINQSPINYDSYKKINIGMSYDMVAKLLGDEGRELSNSRVQVNGKTVTQQIISWNDLDKTKNITVTFNDGKVVAKTQLNL